MSHPNPSHDPENVRTDDHSQAPRARALSKKMGGKKKSSVYAGLMNPNKAHPQSPLGKLHNLLKK